MDDHASSSFIQMHRDDSGYGSPVLTHDFLSPHQSSSTYYSYQHNYHPHATYPNNSFHMYNNNNIYTCKSADTSLTIPIEQHQSMSNNDVCSSPLAVCSNATSTPSKDPILANICPPPYEYKIHWVPPQGRRRRQRTVFTQSNVQQLDSVFMHNQYPDIELRETLAAQMGVPESRIQVWFKNRRTRARTAHRQQLKLSDSSSSH